MAGSPVWPARPWSTLVENSVKLINFPINDIVLAEVLPFSEVVASKIGCLEASNSWQKGVTPPGGVVCGP